MKIKSEDSNAEQIEDDDEKSLAWMSSEDDANGISIFNTVKLTRT